MRTQAVNFPSGNPGSAPAIPEQDAGRAASSDSIAIINPHVPEELIKVVILSLCLSVTTKSSVRGSGVVCWSLLPSSLPGELSIDERDSNF